MPVQFSCPDCGKVLKSANPIAPGKKVKCPSCQAVFAPSSKAPAKRPADDETVELPKTRPAPAAALKKPAKPPMDDDPDFDDPPAKPKSAVQARKPAPRIDDDDDGPPPKSSSLKAGKPAAKPPRRLHDDLDDDDPPAPKARKKGRPTDDDFDDDDRPRKKKKKPAKSNAMLYAMIGGGGGLLAVVAVLLFLWPGFLVGKSDPKGKGGGPGPGPDGGPVPVAAGPDPMPFVPDNAIVVIGVDVNGIRTHKTLNSVYTMMSEMATKADAAKGKTAMEVVGSIDKVVFGMLPAVGKGAGEPMIAVISFGAAVEEAKVHEVFETKPVPGKSYHRGGPGLLALPAEKIVVISTSMSDAAFEAYLTSAGKAGNFQADLRALVESGKGSLAYVAMLNAGSLSNEAQRAMKDVGALDPTLGSLLPVLQRYKAAGLDVRDAGGGLQLKSRTVCASEADAKTVDSVTTGFMKGTLPKFMEALPKEGGGLPPGLGDVLKSLVASYNSGAEGATHWATLDVSAADAATLVNIVLEGALMRGGPGPGPGPGPRPPPGPGPGPFPGPPMKLPPPPPPR